MTGGLRDPHDPLPPGTRSGRGSVSLATPLEIVRFQIQCRSDPLHGPLVAVALTVLDQPEFVRVHFRPVRQLLDARAGKIAPDANRALALNQAVPTRQGSVPLYRRLACARTPLPRRSAASSSDSVVGSSYTPPERGFVLSQPPWLCRMPLFGSTGLHRGRKWLSCLILPRFCAAPPTVRVQALYLLVRNWRS